MGRKNTHEWDYMGWDEERKTEYAYCSLCKGWKANTPYGEVRITHAAFKEREAAGKVVMR